MAENDASTAGESLDAQEIYEQTAALAAHLARAGIRFLPNAQESEVEAWGAHFVAEADEMPEVSVAEVPVAAAPAAVAPPAAVASPARPVRRVESVPAFTSIEGPYPGESLSVAERKARLDDLALQVAGCTQCEVLSNCRTQTVFGEGSSTPRFVFFGEAPGAEEDRSGRPFADQAGQLLTKMIQACKFQREDAYLFNSIKCRPPGSRTPEPGEFQNCRTFYEQQLALLRPEYIVCLGAISAQELLKTKLSVGRLRGKLHTYLESKVVVTYHPSYLLRNPAAKKAAWDDLQMMMKDAGLM
ncbi:uracil-DNA glycosylase [Rubripirellula reticaptiva]|uniref:Type-4 uracil-DNA glycosylase n=1 Tax=Rubripirellula reticaptiva TaxID=2528013 RepID=A0A5C6EIH3_9BACT|nr:uracil-DNA glycosylase [Rubripirellula reticaptiva]TWU48290.1 Uracil DNA glycosylase superfamily protein [Rubripirellula reticaptiva]